MPAAAPFDSADVAQAGVAAASALPANLNLAEVMRIMDVASALRREGELVEQQFNLDATKQLLRERLQKTAELTGETLTPEQLEAAINWYFENLHDFREPEPGIATTLAHLYIRRGLVGACLLATSFLLLGLWWTFTSSWSPVSPAGRRARQAAAVKRQQEDVVRQQAEQAKLQQAVAESAAAAALQQDRDIASAVATIAREGDLMRALSSSPEVSDQLPRWTAQAEVLARGRDVAALQKLARQVAERRDRLDDEYTVSIVPGQQSRSAFERNFEDERGKRISGYYVIVEARDPQGQVVRRRIVNAETGAAEDVNSWAERVPQAVYERLKADKLADGILNETRFAEKRPGQFDDQLVMPGPDGQPLERDAQLTRW